MRKWFFIILGLIFIDQASKFLILRLFSQIVVYNKGIAFGFLASEWWAIINFFILVVIAACLINPTRFCKQKWCGVKRKLPAGLILSGGISNFLDRLFRGAVVDFIDLKVFPIFNLADVFICLGVGIMLLLFCERTRNCFSR